MLQKKLRTNDSNEVFYKDKFIGTVTQTPSGWVAFDIKNTYFQQKASDTKLKAAFRLLKETYGNNK